MYDVEIRDVAERKLAALQHQGAYYEIGKTFQSLYAMIGSRGLFPHIAHGVALYYHDPSETPEKELLSHAAVTMKDATEVPEDLETLTVPSGAAAVLTYKGPYAGLPKVWEHLYATWLPQSGRAPRNEAPYEVYLNDPTNTAPDDLITEVVVPLEP